MTPLICQQLGELHGSVLFNNLFLEAISFLVSHELEAGAAIGADVNQARTGYPVPHSGRNCESENRSLRQL